MSNNNNINKLNEGIENWNRWRETNSGELDFSKVNKKEPGKDHGYIKIHDLTGGNFKNCNFSDANLSGYIFRNTNLHGAKFDNAILKDADFSGSYSTDCDEVISLSDSLKRKESVSFSHSDLYGAKFNEAKLSQANFSGVKTGLSNIRPLQIFSIFMSCLSAFPFVIVSVFWKNFFNNSSKKISIYEYLTIAILAVLFNVFLRLLFTWITVQFSIPGLVNFHVLLGTQMILLLAYGELVSIFSPNNKNKILVQDVIIILAILISLWSITSNFQPLDDFVDSVIPNFPINTIFNEEYCNFNDTNGDICSLYFKNYNKGLLGAIFGAVVALWFSQSAINNKNTKFNWLWEMYIHRLIRSGTSFKGAFLNNAIFNYSTLNATDFEGSKILRTSWLGCKNLKSNYFGDTYLKYPEIRDFFEVGFQQKWKNKNFKDFKLKGINFTGINVVEGSKNQDNLTSKKYVKTNLSEINLSHTDLTDACLHGVILNKANFKGSILNNVDFTESSLTGSILESISYNEKTKFDNVYCEYFVLKAPTDSNDHGKRFPPKHNKFGSQDFEQYFTDKNSLRLYINADVNPEELNIALNNFFINNKEIDFESFRQIRKIGNNLLIEFAVSDEFDTTIAEVDFKKDFSVSEKSEDNISSNVSTHKKNNSYEVKGKLLVVFNNVIGGDSMKINDYSRRQTIKDSKIDISNDSNLVLSDISVMVTDTFNQLPKFNNEPDKKQLKGLLGQLQSTVLETELEEEDKTESLERIQDILECLSESTQNDDDGRAKKIAKRAIRVLQSIATPLPSTAAMVTICNQLPDLIAKIF